MKIEDVFENDEIVIIKANDYNAVYDFTVVNTDVGKKIMTVTSKISSPSILKF